MAYNIYYTVSQSSGLHLPLYVAPCILFLACIFCCTWQLHSYSSVHTFCSFLAPSICNICFFKPHPHSRQVAKMLPLWNRLRFHGNFFAKLKVTFPIKSTFAICRRFFDWMVVLRDGTSITRMAVTILNNITSPPPSTWCHIHLRESVKNSFCDASSIALAV